MESSKFLWDIEINISICANPFFLKNDMIEVHVRTKSKNIRVDEFDEITDDHHSLILKTSSLHVTSTLGAQHNAHDQYQNSIPSNWFHVVNDSTCPFAS